MARKPASKPTAKAAAPANAAAPAADPAADPETGPETGPGDKTVIVIGPAKGRRRCGYRFGQEPTSIPGDQLSEEDFAALMDDPLLAVSIV